jgi:hypothetical protein
MPRDDSKYLPRFNPSVRIIKDFHRSADSLLNQTGSAPVIARVYPLSPLKKMHCNVVTSLSVMAR